MSYKTESSKAHDQRIADGVDLPVDRALMCSAHGCPLRWSVNGDRGRACSAHYWADPRDWPRITKRLVDAEGDHARYAAADRPEPAPAVPLAQRKAIVAALHDFVNRRNNLRAGRPVND